MKSQPCLFRTALSLLAAALVLTLGGPAFAQLADGPWSMYRHDVCHTGQSPNLGPLFTGAGGAPGTPGVNDVKIWNGFDKLRTSPSLSADGKTVFFGMGFDFCAVDTASMTTYDCLVIPADVSDSSPAVGLDGTIYMGDRDNSLNAYTLNRVENPLSLDLTLKWRYNHGHEGDIWQHPIIAPSSVPEAGTIYFTHDQSTDGAGIFTALVDGGTAPIVKWKFKIGNFVRQSSPAIDANGIIYFGDLNGYVYAFADRGACTDNGTLRTQPALTSSCTPNSPGGPVLLWRKQVGSTPGITASPVISAESTTLYIGTMGAVTGIPMGLSAIDISNPCSGPCPAPPVSWTFPTTGKVDQTPALGRDGTLYVPAMNGGQKRLYAVNSNGTPKWPLPFGPINTGSETSAYPIVGGDETVYVGLGNSIYALNPATGAQLWTYATTNFIQASPLLGPVTGGRAILYVPSRDQHLYAISSPRSSTQTPTTCWAEDPDANHPPVANAGPDQSKPSGPATTNVALQGTASDPDNDSPLTVTWAFGDGATHGPCQATTAGCLNPTHAYATANPTVYTATLTVSDGHGGSDTDTVTITVTGGGGGGGTFTDAFNRSDSDALGPGGGGPQWAEPAVNGQYTGNLVINGCGASPCSNGKLKNAARGDNVAYLTALTGANQSASGDFTSGDNNASPRLGVLLRYQDARNHYRLYRISGGSSQLRISKVINGAETILKSIQVPMPAVGSPFHLVGSVVGSTLTLAAGGTTISVTDTKYTTGSVGVLVNTGPTATHSADNFCAGIGAATCP